MLGNLKRSELGASICATMDRRGKDPGFDDGLGSIKLRFGRRSRGDSMTFGATQATIDPYCTFLEEEESTLEDQQSMNVQRDLYAMFR